jgi:hypothetical protein
MGSYASLAVRDRFGNILGYRSTTTGEMVEWTAAASPEFQRIIRLYNGTIPLEVEQYYLDNPEYLEII